MFRKPKKLMLPFFLHDLIKFSCMYILNLGLQCVFFLCNFGQFSYYFLFKGERNCFFMKSVISVNPGITVKTDTPDQACRNPWILESGIPAICDISHHFLSYLQTKYVYLQRQFYHMTIDQNDMIKWNLCVIL